MWQKIKKSQKKVLRGPLTSIHGLNFKELMPKRFQVIVFQLGLRDSRKFKLKVSVTEVSLIILGR